MTTTSLETLQSMKDYLDGNLEKIQNSKGSAETRSKLFWIILKDFQSKFFYSHNVSFQEMGKIIDEFILQNDLTKL